MGSLPGNSSVGLLLYVSSFNTHGRGGDGGGGGGGAAAALARRRRQLAAAAKLNGFASPLVSFSLLQALSPDLRRPPPTSPPLGLSLRWAAPTPALCAADLAAPAPLQEDVTVEVANLSEPVLIDLALSPGLNPEDSCVGQPNTTAARQVPPPRPPPHAHPIPQNRDLPPVAAQAPRSPAISPQELEARLEAIVGRNPSQAEIDQARNLARISPVSGPGLIPTMPSRRAPSWRRATATQRSSAATGTTRRARGCPPAARRCP